jgi:dihydrolipoamide dehydrogenase
MGIGETEGFVKFIVDGKYGGILGVHIVGPHATDLIAEAVLAIANELTVEEVMSTIHSHPTLSEVMQEAAYDTMGRAIHK